MTEKSKYTPFLVLVVSLTACGTNGSRMSDEHRQALINQISSGHRFDQVSYCRNLLTNRGMRSSTSFPRSPQLVPGTIELDSFEQSKEQTSLGDTEIIQASYSAKYELTCLELDPASIGSFPRSLDVPVEVCVEGFISLYNYPGIQNFELMSMNVNNVHSCPGSGSSQSSNTNSLDDILLENSRHRQSRKD